MSKNLFEINHPIVEHKLGFLRDKNTSSAEFRSIIKELTKIIGYEATKDLEVTETQIETPLAKTNVKRVKNPPIIVSIMRAGNGMMDSMLTLLPYCRAGHIKLPENVEGCEILLLDPLLATGDTVIASIDRLKQYGVGKIKLLTILTNKIGVARVHEFHPEVDIYTFGAQEELNEKGYLVPGLGDAGDRLFNTLA